MANPSKKFEARQKRKVRVRKQIRGTTAKPRLCIFRSLKYTYAQLISDEDGKVLGAASTRTVKVEGGSAGSKAGAKSLGLEIAKIATAKNIKAITFDRNGYLYHGRVAAVAEGAREGGLEF